MSAYTRKYGVALTTGTYITIPVVKAGSSDFALSADWTPATGDVKVTKDDGTPANITTLPTYIANQGWRFAISATELQCKKLDVLVTDAATKAVEDQFFTIETFGHGSAMYLDDPTSGDANIAKYGGNYGPGIYLDTTASNTNTVYGTDGTFSNPVSTIAAATTLASSLGMEIIYIFRNSTVDLSGLSFTDYAFVGVGLISRNIVNLGTAASPSTLVGCEFKHLTVYGTHDLSDKLDLQDCLIDDAPAAEITKLRLIAYGCGILDDITLDTSDDNIFDHCFSAKAGNTYAVINASGATGSVMLRHHSGGVGLNNLSASHKFSIEGDGQVVFESGCNINAVGAIRGNWSITDNTAGMLNVTTSAALAPALAALNDLSAAQVNAEVDTALADYGANTTTPPTAAAIADQVWDELVSGHNIAGSFGRFVRQIKESTLVIEASVNDLSATNSSFITDLTEATDNHYQDVSLIFIDGSLIGQSRPIATYNGTTKAVTFDEPFTEAPANGDSFLIRTDHVHTVSEIQAGLATSAEIAALNDLSAAEVNAEVVDVLVTDTHAEPASVPAATSSIKDKINWLFALARNKLTQTATTATLRNDNDDADIATSTDSDDGTTGIRGEWS